MKYYMVGIKGAGMSALAKLLVLDGHIVEGVDVGDDFYTSKSLENIKIYSFDEFILKDDFFYIIGNAYLEHDITKSVINSGLSYEYYPIFISKYFKDFSMIAVSGSHGKTTSSTMLKTILNDSTYLIGDGSSGKGNNKNFILEACEYKDTFLNYKPYIGLVLNIDYDHPDYFKNYNDYYVSFIKFMNNCNICVINGDNISYRNKHIITYGMNKDNDVVFSYNDGKVIFNDSEYILPFKGLNYAYNFMGAYIVSKLLNVKDKDIFKRINLFKFPLRRNERISYQNKIIINDYAHHPTEIKNIYDSLKEEYKNANIVCIFEPHTISRLVCFKEQFKEVLDRFDKCYLYEVFTSVREKENKQIINDIYNYFGYSLYDENTIEELKYFEGIICFLGAGNIDKEYVKFKKIC